MNIFYVVYSLLKTEKKRDIKIYFEMACLIQIFLIILLSMPSSSAKKATPSKNTTIDQFFRPINSSHPNTTSTTNTYQTEEQKIQPVNQSIVVESVTIPNNSEQKSTDVMEEEDDDEIIHINPPIQQPPPPCSSIPTNPIEIQNKTELVLEYEEIPPLIEDITYTFQYKRYVNLPFMLFDDKQQRIFKIEEWKVFKKIICSNYSTKNEILNVFTRLGQAGIAISFYFILLLFFNLLFF